MKKHIATIGWIFLMGAVLCTYLELMTMNQLIGSVGFLLSLIGLAIVLLEG